MHLQKVTKAQIEKFQQNLSHERYVRGITQAELSEAIGVTQGHLSYIEHGKRDLTRERYYKIIEYFMSCEG